MKPLYISSSGPAAPARLLLSSTPHPPAPSSKSHLGSCRLGPPLRWPLLGEGVSAPAAVPVRTHISFSLPLSPLLRPLSLPPTPPRLHLRTHLELLTFYLHYIHHSVPSSHLSWIVGGRGGPELGKMVGNRDGGGETALPPHPFPWPLAATGEAAQVGPSGGCWQELVPSLLMPMAATTHPKAFSCHVAHLPTYALPGTLPQEITKALLSLVYLAYSNISYTSLLGSPPECLTSVPHAAVMIFFLLCP